MYDVVLVANRGEIARRIIRTLHGLDIRAIAVHSEADAGALHVAEADESVLLRGAAPTESYLDVAKVLEAAERTGAQAIHPGYGFLPESPDFAQAVLDAGHGWVGPSPACITAVSDKNNARNLMSTAGVPVAPGTAEPVRDVDAALVSARELGFPLMVKASAGGGGIGMGVAEDGAGLRGAFETARSRAERFFGSPEILLERYVPHARHVEVQVFGLADGTVLALGGRDCSVQRRHQKVAEETPSPGIGAELRSRMFAAAIAAGRAVDYEGAGTVECLVDPDKQEFVFLEMNTRLQVEHPVTELVTGLDLVAEQLRVAAGDPPGFDPAAPPVPIGHAVELRVYAEDPKRFLPGPGTISRWVEPTGEGIRVDAGYRDGDTVTPYYDPLLAKLCAYGADRAEALARLRVAVDAFVVEGPKVNLPFFVELLAEPSFLSGAYDTGIIGRMRP